VAKLPTNFAQELDQVTDAFFEAAGDYLNNLEALRDNLDGDDNYLDEVAALTDVHTEFTLFLDVVEQLRSNLTAVAD
jgi:hypothetical protein